MTFSYINTFSESKASDEFEGSYDSSLMPFFKPDEAEPSGELPQENM